MIVRIRRKEKYLINKTIIQTEYLKGLIIFKNKATIKSMKIFINIQLIIILFSSLEINKKNQIYKDDEMTDKINRKNHEKPKTI